MPKKAKTYEELLKLIQFYDETRRGDDIIVAANKCLSIIKNEMD